MSNTSPPDLKKEKMIMKEFLQDNLRVFVVPVDIMDVPSLDIYEQMVYMVLRSFANPREATAFPSYNTIAKLGRMSRRKAIDCVTSLVEKGLLKKEVRLDVTKNRKIRNTSNLYTIESPRVVHSVHQGSAQCAPGVVHAVHQGSAQRAPEHNHLTKSLRTKSLNNKNNNKEIENHVVVSSDEIKKLLSNYGITVNDKTIQKWNGLDSRENILKAITHTLKRPEIKNVVGYVTRILETGFVPLELSRKNQQLPSYVINQINKEEKTVAISINPEQQKEVLDLLFKLGEIDQESYKNQLQELEKTDPFF